MEDSYYIKNNELYRIELTRIVKLDLSTQDGLDKALMEASYSDNLDILKFLLEGKANINCKDGQPLINAINNSYQNDNMELINFLISSKADVTAQNNEALIKAIEKYGSDLTIIKLLIENKADPSAQNNQAIIDVCTWKYSDFSLIKLLVENNADVTVQYNRPILETSYGIGTSYWWDPQNVEEKKALIESVEYLISKGADANELSKEAKNILISKKYFKRWRKFVFKNFIRKIIMPLYYSPGFPGEELEKKLTLNNFKI